MGSRTRHFRLHECKNCLKAPYSPDLNPIEQVFAKLKSILRSAAARTREALWTAIGAALNALPSHECQNYFADAGYLHSA